MKTKICTNKKCLKEKPLLDFYKNKNTKDGHKTECIVCYNIKQKIYRDKNKEKINKKSKEWYYLNREKRLEQCKKYQDEHKEHYKQYRKEYNKENRKQINMRSNKYNIQKRKEDLNFRLTHNLRSRINKALNGFDKALNTMMLIGCEIDYLMYHLQEQFTSSMSWDNYGLWHIDHIKPCSKFDLSKSEEQQKCFHYSNLQPLWAIDNFRKNKK